MAFVPVPLAGIAAEGKRRVAAPGAVLIFTRRAARLRLLRRGSTGLEVGHDMAPPPAAELRPARHEGRERGARVWAQSCPRVRDDRTCRENQMRRRTWGATLQKFKQTPGGHGRKTRSRVRRWRDDYAGRAAISAIICSRMTNFCGLPVAVSGNSGTKRIWRGTL
jgi:hypothetical protein